MSRVNPCSPRVGDNLEGADVENVLDLCNEGTDRSRRGEEDKSKPTGTSVRFINRTEPTVERKRVAKCAADSTRERSADQRLLRLPKSMERLVVG